MRFLSAVEVSTQQLHAVKFVHHSKWIKGCDGIRMKHGNTQT